MSVLICRVLLLLDTLAGTPLINFAKKETMRLTFVEIENEQKMTMELFPDLNVRITYFDDCGFVVKKEKCHFDDVPRKVLVFMDSFFEGVDPDWKVKDMDCSWFYDYDNMEECFVIKETDFRKIGLNVVHVEGERCLTHHWIRFVPLIINEENLKILIRVFTRDNLQRCEKSKSILFDPLIDKTIETEDFFFNITMERGSAIRILVPEQPDIQFSFDNTGGITKCDGEIQTYIPLRKFNRLYVPFNDGHIHIYPTSFWNEEPNLTDFIWAYEDKDGNVMGYGDTYNEPLIMTDEKTGKRKLIQTKWRGDMLYCGMFDTEENVSRKS